MSEIAEKRPVLPGRKTVVILGGFFLTGFAVCAVLAGVDRAQRQKLEEITTPSAAGEPVTFVLPQTPAAAEAPVMNQGGVSLYIVKYEGAHDEDLRKAGTDDTGKIPLYHRFNKDGRLKEGYRVKIVPGVYAVLGEKKK